MIAESGLEDLGRKADELCAFAQTNKNVHKEVKKLAMEIQHLVFQAASRAKNNEEELKSLQKEFQEYKQEQEKRMQSLERKITEQNTQHEIRDLSNLKSDDSYDEFTKICNKRWSENCYQNVNINYEDVFNLKTEHISFIMSDEENSTNSLTKRIQNRYPEIEGEERMSCKEGSYIEMEQRSHVKIGSKVEESSRNILFFFTRDIDKENDPREKTFN
jgi:ElaB/YqjD/DUF883 family membrane-anchored ribosome-binding protein